MTGRVSVVLCESDYGHDMQLEHLRLSQSERERIAGQLKIGITQEVIMDDVRTSDAASFEQIHLLSKKYTYPTSSICLDCQI